MQGMRRPIFYALLLGLGWAAPTSAAAIPLEWIAVSRNGAGFRREGSNQRFILVGFNYDHNERGRALEDYWTRERPKVVQDFREMKALGANVVRVHLQFGRLVKVPGCPKRPNLRRLDRLVRLAERLGLHLDLTGPGCYHRLDVPPWYDTLGERERWAAQVEFGEAVGRVCASSPAVFCYDLMNEPVVPGDHGRLVIGWDHPQRANISSGSSRWTRRGSLRPKWPGNGFGP